MNRLCSATVVAALATLAIPVAAQDNVFKVGVTRYDTHARTSGISGVGIPPGADATIGDATTLILVGERMLTPNVGIELVVGIPPKIKATASGTVAFLGPVLEAKNAAPTLLVNYHFGAPGQRWRPYVGAGINYTKFVSVRTPYAWDVSLSDSTGAVVQAGVDVALDKRWGLFASVATLEVKSDLVAVGATVLRTTIDFRPVVWSAGVSYRF